MKTLLRIAVLLLLVPVVRPLANAQVNQLGQSGLLSATSVQQTTSNYYFAKPNELTIIVNVIGFVQRPGRYEISKSIDLVNLLALAGGGLADGDMGEVKITRLNEAEGRIVRGDFKVDLDDIARVKASDLVLAPGDVVQIDRSGWATFRDTFGVVVSFAVITSAVAQVIWAIDRTNN